MRQVIKSLVVFCQLMVLFSFTLVAQQASEEIELTRAVIQTQRQAIRSQAMNLSDEESKRFWPVFREYLLEVNRG